MVSNVKGAALSAQSSPGRFDPKKDLTWVPWYVDTAGNFSMREPLAPAIVLGSRRALSVGNISYEWTCLLFCGGKIGWMKTYELKKA